MERQNIFLLLDDKIVNDYKEHLDKVGYDKNKLFEKILISFLKESSKTS